MPGQQQLVSMTRTQLRLVIAMASCYCTAVWQSLKGTGPRSARLRHSPSRVVPLPVAQRGLKYPILDEAL